MKSIYIRSKNSIRNINIFMISLLSILAIAGFYKNGAVPYINDQTGIYGLLKPIILSFTGLIIGILINYLDKGKKNPLTPVYGLIVASMVSINTNIFVFILTTALVIFFLRKFKINTPAIAILLIYIITLLLGNFTYLNSFEASREFSFDVFDYLNGSGIGGNNATYGGLIFISLILLSFKMYYKTSIAIFSISTYIILIFGFLIFADNTADILSMIFSNGILFSFVFLATDPYSSSYTKVGEIISGILIGALTFGISFLLPQISAVIAIVIVSILSTKIDKITIKKG